MVVVVAVVVGEGHLSGPPTRKGQISCGVAEEPLGPPENGGARFPSVYVLPPCPPSLMRAGDPAAY